MATVAGRYEDFSDFGSNFSWRVAARLQMTDSWVLRGSAGTGFRAPTPGQISSIRVATAALGNEPVTRGIFPPQDPASQIFGATPLQDETSTQYTLGVAYQPSDAFTLTLDYYFIALDDRIWISSNFNVGPEERAELIALGAPGADQLTNVRFFTNDMDTETSGIDLVAQYIVDWSAGNTLLSLAVNYNETEVTRRTDRQTDPANPDPVYFLSNADLFRLENGDPDTRVNFTATHSWANNFSASLRGNWYADYQFTNNTASQVQDMSGDAYWDIDLTWYANDAISVTLGGNNIFDTAPDTQPSWFTCCGITVHTASVMDWQGPYYYIRGIFSWN